MSTSNLDRQRRVGAIRAGVGMVLLVLAVVLSAGRADWLAGWLYVGLVAAVMIITRVTLARRNPELLARRASLGEGTKGWDKVFVALYLPIIFSVVVVAGLDAGRYGWSSMNGWLWPIGFVGFCAASALGTWAMVQNPHFESSVRIQHDRGHRVIDSGPYRLVRHPAYTGVVLHSAAMPLLLGSWWSYLPASALIVWVALRTALEDRTLQRELPGYADYARRVRFRLIPGLW